MQLKTDLCLRCIYSLLVLNPLPLYCVVAMKVGQTHRLKIKKANPTPTVQPCSLHLLFSTTQLSSILQRILDNPIVSLSYQDGENHKQNRGLASRQQLLLPRILPPKDNHGLLESTRPSRPYVSSLASSIHNCYLGRWRIYCDEVIGIGGVMPERARSHDMFASYLHEYEPNPS